MDFRELNAYIDTFTAHADVCADKMRQWRRQGVNLAIVDLKKAYLQIHIDESLWPYQTVVFMGRRYCLTRLGFGLNVAPLIMKTVLNHVLAQNAVVKKGTSAYIDDILVNEDIVSANQVQEHLAQYGLSTKAPEKVANGARILGLRVWGEHGRLNWKRDAELPSLPNQLTRRNIFAYCGQLTGHFPVCGWLRVATAFVKRKANELTAGWDDPICGPELVAILRQIDARVRQHDPVRGRWDVTGETGKVWVDASGIAIGVAVEIGGSIVEDATWLRPDDARHINMAELDAVIRGLNIALAWGLKGLEILTDSATVHRWVSDGISGKARLNTKAAGEMLIRRRISTVQSLVEEYGLQVVVSLVKSAENKADTLTRVPQEWLKPREAAAQPMCALTVETSVEERIREIHHTAGHPGVRRTFYFAKRSDPDITRRQVQAVVSGCEICKSIDPAPVKWRQGCLSVERVWQRLAMDITHCGGHAYLTLIDSGPSRFAIWRPLRHQSSANVVSQLESVFLERGAPEEILADNDTVFRSRMFEQLAAKWGVKVRFRSAYYPAGNGIAERCHRTIKVIVARKGCAVAEAVYLYNITPRDDCNAASAPANVLYSYQVRPCGVGRSAQQDPSESTYRRGDLVWVKPPGARCDTRYHKGTVTEVISDRAVEVDGMPRHIRDLRRRAATGEQSHARSLEGNSSDEIPTTVPVAGRVQEVPNSRETDNREMESNGGGSGDRSVSTEGIERMGENATERTDDQETRSDASGVPASIDYLQEPSRHSPEAKPEPPRRSSRLRRKRTCPICD
uniref:Integrase catalytic domain-containing protein n=1 Tax=Trichuris muris TaxID=70415 RepID=A0A5S6QBG4_TRIMR